MNYATPVWRAGTSPSLMTWVKWKPIKYRSLSPPRPITLGICMYLLRSKNKERTTLLTYITKSSLIIFYYDNASSSFPAADDGTHISICITLQHSINTRRKYVHIYLCIYVYTYIILFMLLDRVLPFPCTFLKYLFIFTDFTSGNSQKTVTSILAHVQFWVAGVRQCKYKTVF